MNKSNYNKILKLFARENRVNGTKAEAVLWKFVLRSNQMNYQFNRQFAIENYIVDFICRKLKLIIEIDGSSHFKMDSSNTDYIRQESIENLGYHFLRFSEKDVLQNLESVITKIEFAIFALESNTDFKE